MFSKYEVLLWDFDGVILDSMPIRSQGFWEVLKDFPQAQVAKLIQFHEQNGGLSRYVKFRYFYEEILKESISDEQVTLLASRFSEIMLALLCDKQLLISDSVSFIKANHANFYMHIVSGSDGNELRKICDALNLTQYFRSISGSPVPKVKLVQSIMEDIPCSRAAVALIGDSKNDYDAALANDIDFYGYNNPEVVSLSKRYITSFEAI